MPANLRNIFQTNVGTCRYFHYLCRKRETFVFDERYFVNVRRDTVAEAYKKYQNVCAKFLIKDFL